MGKVLHIEGDYLIGADGYRSLVRRQIDIGLLSQGPLMKVVSVTVTVQGSSLHPKIKSGGYHIILGQRPCIIMVKQAGKQPDDQWTVKFNMPLTRIDILP